MKKVCIRFPHQLFRHPGIAVADMPIFLVEESLFFTQYAFHKQKLAFHRASMKRYAAFLEVQGYEVAYVNAQDRQSDIRELLRELIAQGYDEFHLLDPTDDWLETRIRENTQNVRVLWSESPLFMNTKAELAPFFQPSKKSYFQTTFYKGQRKKYHILLSGGKPQGGRWSHDRDNRKKYPKNATPPSIRFPETNEYHEEAKAYVGIHFSNNPGSVTDNPIYPTSFEEADSWFEEFLQTRFYRFGDYEDALVKDAHFLHHSVLSPLLNVGLLSPGTIVERSVAFAEEARIPINSTEGFVRQILGWREFIRGVYQSRGREERTRNFWNHSRPIPQSFYSGTTGIAPVDHTIKKVLETGYAHHIERLMVLSNFMLLCGFHPDAVYRWFMELFIDAYDWVMVPNVYGMGLFADGGLMSTKPYISGSNYINKMGDFKGGPWEHIWDGLFWNFIDENRPFFEHQPRLALLLRNFDRMTPEKKARHLETAREYLASLKE